MCLHCAWIECIPCLTVCICLLTALVVLGWEAHRAGGFKPGLQLWDSNKDCDNSGSPRRGAQSAAHYHAVWGMLRAAILVATTNLHFHARWWVWRSTTTVCVWWFRTTGTCIGNKGESTTSIVRTSNCRLWSSPVSRGGIWLGKHIRPRNSNTSISSGVARQYVCRCPRRRKHTKWQWRCDRIGFHQSVCNR
jgi:hypothetical protein